MNAIANGIRGRKRLEAVRIHRVAQFLKAFDSYVAGRVPASYVAARRKKMYAVGLPRGYK